jgi:tripartite-type tricarboxylate transporter receptor subunit TctC
MHGDIDAKKILGTFIAATLIIWAAQAPASPDRYPDKTVKFIVPLPPGGVADALPRILADKLSAKWGQPVIIENRSGAANRIGSEAVAKSEPDGYTLLAAPQGALVLPKPGFDPSIFVPVSVIGSLPVVLVANPKAPFSTLRELIAFAQANPTKVTYGSSGVGSAFQMITEMLQAVSGIRLAHVPYPGMAPAMRDLLAGHIDMTVDNLGNALPQITSGKLKALAVAGSTRLPELPDVAAIAETFPDFDFTEWFAVVAPPKIPSHIVERLSRDIDETLRMADVAKRFREYSVMPVGSSPADSAAFLKQQRERWKKVMTVTGVGTQ